MLDERFRKEKFRIKKKTMISVTYDIKLFRH